MEEFFTQEFYGNTIGQYLIAFSIIVGSIVVGRILFWLVAKFVERLTRKTKSKLDDIIVEKSKSPVIFGIVIWGIWFGIHTLTIGPELDRIMSRIYYVLVIFNISWMIIRLLDALIEEYLVPLVRSSSGDLDDQLLPVIRQGIRATLWTIAVIVALNNAGYDVGAVLAGLGIGGLAFALAAQDTVSNLFGGFTIFADKPFRVRDRIDMDGYDGVVEEIGLRSTRLRTLDGRIVTIPNSSIANSAVTNISSEPSRKVINTLGLTYDTSAKQLKRAMEILQNLTAPNEKLEKETIITFQSFGDFSLNIRFVYFIKKELEITDEEEYNLIISGVNLQILEAFNAEGLDFAFPTQTIHATVESASA